MKIGTYVDIALIVTIIGLVGFYAFRGFVRALRPFRKWGAIAVAWSFKAPFAGVLGKIMPFTEWRSSMEENAYAAWKDSIEKVMSSGEPVTEESFDKTFGIFDTLFAGLKEKCMEALHEGAMGVADTVSKFFADQAISLISQAIAFVVLFFGCMLLFTVALFIVERVCDGTIIGTVNHLVGGVLGLIVGITVAWVASLLIVNVFPGLVAEGGSFTHWMQGEFILSRMLGITPKL